MSEFVVFIELISTVITRIIKLIFELLEFSWNVVTNAIAFAIYCTMQFLPWKNYECSLMYPTEVFTSMRFLPSSWDSSNDYYTYDIRDVAFEQFANLLFDLLLFMPSFCIILLNPLEYYNLGVVWRKYSQNPVNETYNLYFFDTKFGLVEGALRSLFGIFTLLFVPFIFLNPYRLWMYLNVVPRLWERRCDTVNKLKQGLDMPQKPLTHIYYLNIMMGVYSVVDIFVIVPTVCIVSCIPSLWYCFFGGIYECYVKDNSREKYLTIIDNEVYNITLDEPPELRNKVVRGNINSLLYAFCGVQYEHALVDIISIPLTIIALLSPLRHSALRSALHEITAVETESARTKEYHLNPLVVAPPDDIDFSTYRYSYESRISGMTFGFLSILDFFLLPFLIPLWLTWYRWSPVHDQLRLVRVWNFNEVLVVLRQSSYLAADVMILLFLVPIIYVTRYRWKPVQVALELSDGVSPDKTLGVHYTVVQTIIFMLLDVLTAPILFLILVTWYRSHSVYVYFSRENYFHLNLAYYAQMLSELLILIHDACIIMPVLIVTSVLSPWRLPLILSLVKYQAITCCCAWTHQSCVTSEDNKLCNVATDDVQGGNTLTKETTPLNADDSLSNLSSYRVPEEFLHQGDTCCCFSQTESSWRRHVYMLFLQIFVDWPILLMSSIIVSTVWRIGTTCIAIKEVIANNHRYRFYHYYHDEFSEYMLLESNAKWEVVKQFCLLLRDIFFLIPFSIIVATVYRLPFLLIDLISRLAADPSPDANPLFEVVECKVDYPEKAAPLISLQLLPSYMDNSHNNYKYSNNLKIESAKLFVSGQSFWDTCSATLGPSIVGIAKTLLPLKLVNDKSIGISEFNGQIVEATSILPLWIRLDSLSKVKRSSVLKKLHKLSSSVDMEVTHSLTNSLTHSLTYSLRCRWKVLWSTRSTEK